MTIGLELLLSWPEWVRYLYLGIVWMIYISVSGVVLARLGFRPLWALLLVVPYANWLVLVLLAYARWPLAKISNQDNTTP
jgi:hypothetical protein